MMDYYNGYGTMSGWGVLGFILNLVLIGAVIVGVVYLIRYLAESSRHVSKTALDTLKERYAKGEISKKEFEEMKKDVA